MFKRATRVLQNGHGHNHLGANGLGCVIGGANDVTSAGCLAAQNKRKEKARIAARQRRSQEANIIMEMANELQITQEKMRKIDKAAIVKLAIDYIKAFEILCRFRSINSLQDQLIRRDMTLSWPPSASTSNLDANDDINHHSNNNVINMPTMITKSTTNYITTTKKTRRDSKNNPCDEYSSISDCNEHHHNHLHANQADLDDHSNSVRNSSGCNSSSYSDSSSEVPICASPNTVAPAQAIVYKHLLQNPQEQQLLLHQDQHLGLAPSAFSAPKLTTTSIFAPKTEDMSSHFLMIKSEGDGRPSFVLKLDEDVVEDDDLTHLAPQAGDISISLEVEPLDGIVLDTSLFCGPGLPVLV